MEAVVEASWTNLAEAAQVQEVPKALARIDLTVDQVGRFQLKDLFSNWDLDLFLQQMLPKDLCLLRATGRPQLVVVTWVD